MAPTPLSGPGQAFADAINSLALYLPGARPINSTNAEATSTDNSPHSSPTHFRPSRDDNTGSSIASWIWIIIILGIIVIAVFVWRPIRNCFRRDRKPKAEATPADPILGQGSRNSTGGQGSLMGQQHRKTTAPEQQPRYVPRGPPASQGRSYNVRGVRVDYVAKAQREQQETDVYMHGMRVQQAAAQQAMREARQRALMEENGTGRQWPIDAR